MITLFTTPKAFTGRFHTIQRNALRSWTLLRPRPDIVLIGNEEGTAEMAAEIGARHFPDVACTPSGVPLVHSVIGIAEQAAAHDVMCLVLADIILMSDFMDAARRFGVLPEAPRSLVIGRKRILDIPDPIDFEAPDWEARWRARVRTQAKVGTSDTDYWMFRRGLWAAIPEFAIGRYYWSAWLTYQAAKSGARVIDATAAITAVESSHDYSHVTATRGRILQSADVAGNAQAFGDAKFWTTANAPFLLTESGLQRSPWRRRLWGVFLGLDHRLGLDFHVKRAERPYLLPLLHGVYRLVRPLALAAKQWALRNALESK